MREAASCHCSGIRGMRRVTYRLRWGWTGPKTGRPELRLVKLRRMWKAVAALPRSVRRPGDCRSFRPRPDGRLNGLWHATVTYLVTNLFDVDFIQGAANHDAAILGNARCELLSHRGFAGGCTRTGLAGADYRTRRVSCPGRVDAHSGPAVSPTPFLRQHGASSPLPGAGSTDAP